MLLLRMLLAELAGCWYYCSIIVLFVLLLSASSWCSIALRSRFLVVPRVCQDLLPRSLENDVTFSKEGIMKMIIIISSIGGNFRFVMVHWFNFEDETFPYILLAASPPQDPALHHSLVMSWFFFCSIVYYVCPSCSFFCWREVLAARMTIVAAFLSLPIKSGWLPPWYIYKSSVLLSSICLTCNLRLQLFCYGYSFLVKSLLERSSNPINVLLGTAKKITNKPMVLDFLGRVTGCK